MAATVEIHVMSALATGVDATGATVRFKSSTGTATDANNPLVIPASGTNYSYTRKLRLFLKVGPVVTVEFPRWYSDGTNSFGTGVSCRILNIGVTFGTQFKTAQVGDQDLFEQTEESGMMGNATDAGPWGPAAEGTYIGDLIELQMGVASTASAGTLTGETLTVAWTEAAATRTVTCTLDAILAAPGGAAVAAGRTADVVAVARTVGTP